MSADLDFNKVLTLLMKDKYKTVVSFLLFSGLAVFYALSLPNEYTSKVLVSSNMSESKGASALGSLSGLASMAGVSLGGDGMSPEVVKEALSSNYFLGDFVQNEGIAPQIMAAVAYDPSSQTFIYDETIYDAKSKSWSREVDYPKKQTPSIEELATKFKEKLSIGFDRKTKLISISYTSFSPEFSQKVLESLVKSFNIFMRERNKQEAEQTIKYLKHKLVGEGIVEVRSSLQQLLEEQLKKLAFSETRTEYALKTVDMPLSPSEKSAPRRAIICILVSLVGTFLSALLFLTIRLWRS